MTGWKCSNVKCVNIDKVKWQGATSSLVKSNFKFTKSGKPICVKCWNNGIRGDNHENARTGSAPSGW